MVDFEEAMLEISWKSLETANKRHSDLDTKAIGLITITGILITFLLGSVNSSSGISGSKTLFIITSLSFLTTVLISVSVLRIRPVEVLSSEKLLSELENEENQEVQIKGILGTVADMESKMSIKCNSKADNLKFAVYFLGISIIFLILYVISIPFNFILITK